MTDVHHALISGLLLWSLMCMGGSTIGQFRAVKELTQSFWFMTGLWGLVDGLIAWYVHLRPPLPLPSLAPILRLNAGLDLIYIAAGAWLFWRSSPRLRGFGLAVLIQGVFLLGFDVYFWRECLASL